MYLLIKRFFDIFFSLLVLIILFPIFFVIVILLRLTGEGEILYGQKRVGFKNNIFDILKFATMLKNSPNIGTGAITLRNDPRVTPMGKFLRKSKINELPQILNIIKGDMSIVGPRPLMPISFEKYSEEVQSKVYNVKPGLTGIGSIIFRDEEKLVSESNLAPEEYYKQNIFPYKGQLEMWYLQNVSFITDFKIIFITAWSIIFPDNKFATTFFKDIPKRHF
jgi:lipopolysaccharide/colanic/teichoic acid biosynthesis glycosyltransferase